LARVDKFTALNRIPIYYSDFLNNFDLNPVTDQLAVVVNEQAVAQSIRNIVLTNLGERFYHPEIGSKVQSLVFEPSGPITDSLLQLTITESIQNQEPRANLLQIEIDDQTDPNTVLIYVTFSMINITKPVTVSIAIQRVR